MPAPDTVEANLRVSQQIIVRQHDFAGARTGLLNPCDSEANNVLLVIRPKADEGDHIRIRYDPNLWTHTHRKNELPSVPAARVQYDEAVTRLPGVGFDLN